MFEWYMMNSPWCFFSTSTMVPSMSLIEEPASTCNRFLFKNNSELMFHIALKKVIMVHDELLLVHVIDVHHGDRNVPEVPETNCNQFLFKNCSELMYHIALKKVLVVNDELLHVLVVDVHHGDQNVSEVPETNRNFYSKTVQN